MQARVGVSGTEVAMLPDFLENAEEIEVDTPYGKPAGQVSVGNVGNVKVAYLNILFTKEKKTIMWPINFRANVWAWHKLGVNQIIQFSGCGSLNPAMRPGDLIVYNDFIDLGRTRPVSFYWNEPEKGLPPSEMKPTLQIILNEPFCPEIRNVLLSVARDHQMHGVHPEGIMVNTEGPRFETPAENRAFRTMGADAVTMGTGPECALARELNICYAGIGVVENFAVGIRGKVSMGDLPTTGNVRGEDITKLLVETIKRLPEKRGCSCEEDWRKSSLPYELALKSYLSKR